MKIENLRIGNWVKYKDKYYRIHQLSIDIYNKDAPSIGLVSASGKVLYLLQDELDKINTAETPTKEMFSKSFDMFKKSNTENINISQIKAAMFYVETVELRLKEKWLSYLISIL